VLPEGLAVAQLDSLFQLANPAQCIRIPTGVGFCLFIRRDCLEATGLFDEAAFGKGYGEENDFCLRASAHGWKHVLAADCFVFHQGRASFGNAKDARVRSAYETLVARHPRYPMLVQRHFADDPARSCRLRVDALRLARDARGVRLFADTSPVLEETTAAPLLRLDAVRPGLIKLHWANPGEGFRLWFRLPKETDDLVAILSALGATQLGAMPIELARPVRTRQGAGVKSELFELVTRHAYPRLPPLQVCGRTLALLALRLSELRLLRPLAAIVPRAVRAPLRRWLRAERL
jgi:hypothetical protein